MNNKPKDYPHMLDAILSRPGMFWGNSTNHFHSFLAFLSGYELGRDDRMDEERHKQMGEIVPPEFHKYVTEHFGYDYPHGGYGWQTFIEENSKSDKEALELFVRLRKSCIEEKNEA